MDYTQVKQFNPANGGTTPNMCLANVCKGYSIPNKYASAWEAWQHTQQHGGDAPAGLNVPVFFSYTATIDGINKNWGHIGVRLADGRFWSDGNVYSSIAAYESQHWPRYVGWGESINDVTIIKEEDIVKPTEAQVYDAFRRFALQEPASPDQVRYYLARDIRDLYADLLNYSVIPKPAEVQAAFAELQPWSPINTPPYADQTQYYSTRAAKQLYLDLARGLKKRLDAATTPPPAPIDRAVVVDYINKNLS